MQILFHGMWTEMQAKQEENNCRLILSREFS